MTDSINTNNRMKNSSIAGDTRAPSTAKTAKSAAQNKSTASSAEEASVVELSSTTLMEALSEKINSLPIVNEARVEAVKQALVKGEYQPNAEVIARKYSEIEKLLP